MKTNPPKKAPAAKPDVETLTDLLSTLSDGMVRLAQETKVIERLIQAKRQLLQARQDELATRRATHTRLEELDAETERLQAEILAQIALLEEMRALHQRNLERLQALATRLLAVEKKLTVILSSERTPSPKRVPVKTPVAQKNPAKSAGVQTGGQSPSADASAPRQSAAPPNAAPASRAELRSELNDILKELGEIRESRESLLGKIRAAP